VRASALKHSSEKPSRLFFSMAFLMAILQLAGCEKPRPKQPTVATEPSFVELANQISQEELDQLGCLRGRAPSPAATAGAALYFQPSFHSVSPTPGRRLGPDGCLHSQLVRATPNTRLQATLTLEQIGKQLSQSEETASHHWAILVLAQQELAKREASSFPIRQGSLPSRARSENSTYIRGLH
jgi:hypothetical protein